MKISKKSLSTFGVVVGILSLSGVAYAFTSTDFNTRAQSWTAATCTQTLLNSRVNLSNNQKATICYNFLRASEQQNTLNGHQLSIDDLLSRAAVPGPKGDKGDTGEQGPVGPKGDTGAPGIGYQSLKLYDGNNVVLGNYIDSPAMYSTYFDSSINLKISLSLQTGNLTSWIPTKYESQDCTGIAYVNSAYAVAQTLLVTEPENLTKQYFYISNSDAAVTVHVTAWSRFSYGVCTSTYDNGPSYKLTQVTPNITFPIALPISIRYE